MPLPYRASWKDAASAWTTALATDPPGAPSTRPAAAPHPGVRAGGPRPLSLLALMAAVCWGGLPGAQAQQITHGGGHGAGAGGSISGLGGIAGGGGGGGFAGKGGDAAQTPDAALNAGNGAGVTGGLGGAGLAGGGGGAAGGAGDASGIGGGGGTGSVSDMDTGGLAVDQIGTPGSNGGGAMLAPGGGGGGGGLVLTRADVDLSTLGRRVRGGNGGNGGPGDLTFYGAGGGGGAALVLTQGGRVTINGGSAVIGGNGGRNPSLSGGGGDGGAGVFLYAGGTLLVDDGSIRGGDGGGGYTSAGAAGAGVLSNQGTIVNRATITGGTSGMTIGQGRTGGAGVQAWGGSIQNLAGATITGGYGSMLYGAPASGVAGTGGAGILFNSGQPASLFNAGTIQAGAGGTPILGQGTHGDGGVGVYGAASGNTSIVNAGTIAGGLKGDGLTRARAIVLSGSNNRLELWQGSTLLGGVQVASGGANNTLALGGSLNGTFDLSQMGPSQAYRGFDRFDKSGTSIWTVTGSGGHTGDTTISAGTLVLGTTDVAASMAGPIHTRARLEIVNVDSSNLGNITVADGVGSAYFYGTANPGNAQIVNGNLMGFYESSSAGQATLHNKGHLQFITHSSAGNATLYNDSRVVFYGNANGGNAAFINGASGVVDFGYSAGPDGTGKLSAGSIAGDGKFYLGGNELTVGGNDTSSVVTGIIADKGDSGRTGGALTKTGAGTLTLAGKNTYTGATTVLSGVLAAGSEDAFGSHSALKVASGGVFDIGGYNVSVGALSGNGRVTNLGNGTRTLTVDSGQDSTFGGVLSDSSSATLSLTKRGNGTLILTGSNNYAGSLRGERGHTSIYGGTLQFGDGVSTGVNNLGGDVFVRENGVLSIQGPTTVNVANNVNLIANSGVGAGLSIGANANGPSLTADRLIIDNGATLNLSSISGPLEHDKVLIDTRIEIQGNFTTVNIGGYTGAVDYLSLSARKSANDMQYLATYGLNWVARSNLAHGTFTLADAGNHFTIGTVLTDQSANAATGWNGRSLTKAGAGTLVLTGNNTYSGGTHIASGTLQVGDGGSSGAIAGDVVTQGTLAFNRGDTFTFSGNISGNGAVRQMGAGTTILAGTNRYTGGTTIDSGILRAGNVGAFAAGTAYTINGGMLDLNDYDLTVSSLAGNGGQVALGRAALTVDQVADTAYAGAFLGSGTLIKRGSGTLTLTGARAPNLRIADGKMVTTAERLGGNATIDAGATLALEQTGNASYDGLLAGAGRLQKSGFGKLELTGDSSGFAGVTDVTAGTLAVNGKLGGALTVDAAARLQGTGTVGNTRINGTVAPGNSIGVLNVSGNLVLGPGALYEVEVDPSGASDRIVTSGSAILERSAVQVLGGQGTYLPSRRYTILTADGGLTGAFSGVTSNLAFLSPTLGYDASHVYLTMTRNQVGFQSIGVTRNQRAAGAAVDSLGQGNPLYGAVLSLSAPQAQAAFDQFSGEAYASIRTALIEDSRYLREAINDRLRSAFDDAGQAGAASIGATEGQPRLAKANAERAALWGQAFGAWAQTQGNDNAARLSRSNGGFLAGADAPVSRHWRLGVLAGYSRTRFNVKDRSTSGSSDNYHLGVYAGANWDHVVLRSGASHTWHDLSARRDINSPSFADRLTSDYRAGTSQLYGELGYRSRVGPATIEPFVNMAWVKLHTRGFTEQGGAAALTGRRADTHAAFTTLGLRAASTFDTRGAPLTIRGMAGWRHAFGPGAPAATMRFADGGDAYSVSGLPLARNTAVLEAGLDYAATSNTVVGLAYNGQAGSGLSDHGVRATFNLKF
ncbi:autotransporter domain-containing protein [Achromobacter sp. NCFB-sbj8-Ac1-l]|uniref:autotransporter domain-containing protein n=1 Tax=unclassified Achromobacter TaxID=2626865 RepID=UPI004046B311